MGVSEGWGTGAKLVGVAEGGTLFAVGLERSVFCVIIPFFPSTQTLQFIPTLSLSVCLYTPRVLAGHVNISLSSLINLHLLLLPQPPNPQPVPNKAAPNT